MEKGPVLRNVPWCCTAAVLASFGEHGEPSEVTSQKIRTLLGEAQKEVVENVNEELVVIDEAKRIVIAFSVDPKNRAILETEGFKTVDKYAGIQGEVHLMTKHLPPLRNSITARG